MSAALFSLGRVVATPAALEALEEAGTPPVQLLARHQSGDWGEVPPEDARENRRSVEQGFRIISSYGVGKEARIVSLMERFMSLYVKVVLWMAAALVALTALESIIGYTASYWGIAYNDAAVIVASLAMLVLALWKSNLDKHQRRYRHRRR